MADSGGGLIGVALLCGLTVWSYWGSYWGSYRGGAVGEALLLISGTAQLRRFVSIHVQLVRERAGGWRCLVGDGWRGLVNGCSMEDAIIVICGGDVGQSW